MYGNEAFFTRVLNPQQIHGHAEYILSTARCSPDAALYLRLLLRMNGQTDSNDPDILATKRIIALISENAENTENCEENDEIGSSLLRDEIIEYYLPKHLINAVNKTGKILKDTVETQIGVAFIDIADYTYLSKFLSPKENQILLNGLYTAFSAVLNRHGGFLNKIEGDSIMFHFGGMLDAKIQEMSKEEAQAYIAQALFYTCVEMQRVCVYFNEANPDLIKEHENLEAQESISRAFSIISSMRNDEIISKAFNALFQIRIRIGANIGEVSIGNFGPPGEKHLDIIGTPVINAKRMESTAPIGGLRISEDFYKILEQIGVVREYYQRFKTEAASFSGYFQGIEQEELFSFSNVILKDKRNVEFRTYSVQVNPKLPEAITSQVELLLSKGESGANKIIELLKYYRGNKLVIKALENLFLDKNIQLRKHELVKIMYPKKYEKLVEQLAGNEEKIAEHIDEKYNLFDLFKAFGQYQDKVKERYTPSTTREDFLNYGQYMELERHHVQQEFERIVDSVMKTSQFFNVVYPLVFSSIRGCILEYQNKKDEEELTELVEELEVV